VLAGRVLKEVVAGARLKEPVPPEPRAVEPVRALEPQDARLGSDVEQLDAKRPGSHWIYMSAAQLQPSQLPIRMRKAALQQESAVRPARSSYLVFLETRTLVAGDCSHNLLLSR
jgi:hypothetical protein